MEIVVLGPYLASFSIPVMPFELLFVSIFPVTEARQSACLTCLCSQN